MPNAWQFIPDSTLRKEYDLNSAEDWAAAEREKLANEWAELQRKQTAKPASMAEFYGAPETSQYRLPRQTRQTQPAPIGEALGAGLELAGRPQQALYGAMATAPGEELAGARAGWQGQQRMSGSELIRSLGGLGNRTAEDVVGFGADLIADPLNVPLGAISKAPAAIRGLGQLAGEAAPLAGKALRGVNELVTSPELRKLAPGLGISVSKQDDFIKIVDKLIDKYGVNYTQLATPKELGEYKTAYIKYNVATPAPVAAPPKLQVQPAPSGWALSAVDDFVTQLKAKYGEVWAPKATADEWDTFNDLSTKAFAPVSAPPKLRKPHWFTLDRLPLPEQIDKAATKTRQFITFFGNSVARQLDDSPIPLYHATDKDFDIFHRSNDVGFHLGTRDAALARAKVRGRDARVGVFYIRLENPLVMNDLGDWSTISTGQELIARGVLPKGHDLYSDWLDLRDIAIRRAKSMEQHFSRLGSGAESVPSTSTLTRFLFQRYVQSLIKRAGYDGVIYKNAVEDIGSLTYIVFDPTQIKSATHNVGTYSLVNPSTLHAGIEGIGAITGGAVGSQQPADSTEQWADNIIAGMITGGLAAAGVKAAAPYAARAAGAVKPVLGKLLKDETGQLSLGPGERSLVPEQGLIPERGLTTEPIEQVTGEVVPPTGQLPPGPPQPERIFGPPTPKKKGLGWLEMAVDRTRNIAARQGPLGKQLANNLHEWRELYQTQTGDWVTRISNVKALNNKDYDNFIDAIEGSAQPANRQVFDTIVDWARVAVEVEDKALAAGIKMGHLSNYFPHMYDAGTLEKLFDSMNDTQWNQRLDHMVQTGQAATREEANHILRSIADKVHTRKASNLEISRVADFPGYRRDKAVLGEYLADAAKRISYAEMFGPQGEKADRLLGQIAEQGFDKHGELNKLFGVATEGLEYGFRSQKISNVLRATNVLTKLGLGAIINATQPVNTTIVGGLKTLKLLSEATTSKEAHNFAIRIGVITDDALNDLSKGAGYAGKTMAIGAPGFNNVERFNRTFSALAGREMAQDFAKHIVNAAAKGKHDLHAEKGLRGMGLDPALIISRNTGQTQALAIPGKVPGLLTQQEIDRAARNIVERTQFLVDPQDLAPWMSSPWGRVIMQFRTFSYNQTAFLWRDVLEPALPRGLGGDRNVGPLIRFLLLGTPVAIGATALQDKIRGTDSKDWLERGIKKAGLGVLGDILTGLNPPGLDYASGERFAMQVAGLALGPSAGTAMQGAAAIPPALGGSPEQLERFALRQVPVAGPSLANRLVPYNKQHPGRLERPESTGRPAIARPGHPGRR